MMYAYQIFSSNKKLLFSVILDAGPGLFKYDPQLEFIALFPNCMYYGLSFLFCFCKVKTSGRCLIYFSHCWTTVIQFKWMFKKFFIMD